MTAKTIAARISKLNPQDCNDLIDRINGTDIELFGERQKLSPAAEAAWKALESEPAYDASWTVGDRWHEAQAEIVATFNEGDKIEALLPRKLLEERGWWKSSKPVERYTQDHPCERVKGTYQGVKYRRAVLEVTEDEVYYVTPSLCRKAS